MLAQAPSQERQEKLLPVSIAIDSAGQATAPLIKKLASFGVTLGQGIDLDQLDRVSDGKQDYLVYRFTAPGATLAASAQAALEETIQSLPIPKLMTYQRKNGDTVKFVRPAHRLIALHGDQILPSNYLVLRPLTSHPATDSIPMRPSKYPTLISTSKYCQHRAKSSLDLQHARR